MILLTIASQQFPISFGVNNDFIKSHSSRVMTRKNLIKVLEGQMESIGYMKKKKFVMGPEVLPIYL